MGRWVGPLRPGPFEGGRGVLSETDLSLAMMGSARWKRVREPRQPNEHHIDRTDVAVPASRSSSRRSLRWQSARLGGRGASGDAHRLDGEPHRAPP